MELSGNTVLVTGGASGIGVALAQRFLEAGSEVVVCGRREERLEAARREHSRLRTRAADLSTGAGREALADWIVSEHPALNVLVNNAGIQRRVRLSDSEPWGAAQAEIAINLEAPIHLTRLLLPHLLGKERAAVLNVGSGLAFVPLAAVPVYSATKAALRSFTLSLRKQLEGSPVEVIEIAPPAVDTDLGGPGLHKFGIPVAQLADEVFAALARGETEIAVGFAREGLNATREKRDEMFERMNRGR